jgi:4-amino-4-deoxy-L-arabinose transferase-like glycosyltransferase
MSENHSYMNTTPYRKYSLALIIALSLLRLIMSLYFDLAPDEAYYWEMSRHLDWSYYDHPPMVAYMIALFTSVFTHSELAVRLPSIIGLAIASWMFVKICNEFLKNDKAGFFAVILLNLTPAATALGFITTPDTPLAFFWSVGIYAFLKAIHNQKDFWWIITGLALGLGAISKYNMIFFVPGIALTILAFKQNRHLVFTRRYWLMVLLAAIGTLPVLYWNYTNDWASLKFQFAHGLTPSKRGFLQNFGEFLGGQLGTIGPTLFFALWFVSIKSAIKSWKNNDQIRFFLAWLALPMMAFFVYTGSKAKVEANWPQIAYMSAMLLAAEWICLTDSKKAFKWIAGPSIALTALVLLQSFTQILPLPANADVSTRLHGWKKMGETLKQIDQKTGQKAVFVGQGYGIASLAGFYAELPKDRVAEIHNNNSFAWWWKNRTLPPGTDMVYVDDGKFSEAFIYVPRFAEAASQTLLVEYAGKQLRNIGITVFKDLQKELEFK